MSVSKPPPKLKIKLSNTRKGINIIDLTVPEPQTQDVVLPSCGIEANAPVEMETKPDVGPLTDEEDGEILPPPRKKKRGDGDECGGAYGDSAPCNAPGDCASGDAVGDGSVGGGASGEGGAAGNGDGGASGEGGAAGNGGGGGASGIDGGGAASSEGDVASGDGGGASGEDGGGGASSDVGGGCDSVDGDGGGDSGGAGGDASSNGGGGGASSVGGVGASCDGADGGCTVADKDGPGDGGDCGVSGDDGGPSAFDVPGLAYGGSFCNIGVFRVILQALFGNSPPILSQRPYRHVCPFLLTNPYWAIVGQLANWMSCSILYPFQLDFCVHGLMACYIKLLILVCYNVFLLWMSPFSIQPYIINQMNYFVHKHSKGCSKCELCNIQTLI
ncbi:hypothetical protein OROMI_017441 [Orobanche minor]